MILYVLLFILVVKSIIFLNKSKVNTFIQNIQNTHSNSNNLPFLYEWSIKIKPNSLSDENRCTIWYDFSKISPSFDFVSKLNIEQMNETKFIGFSISEKYNKQKIYLHGNNQIYSIIYKNIDISRNKQITSSKQIDIYQQKYPDFSSNKYKIFPLQIIQQLCPIFTPIVISILNNHDFTLWIRKPYQKNEITQIDFQLNLLPKLYEIKELMKTISSLMNIDTNWIYKYRQNKVMHISFGSEKNIPVCNIYFQRKPDGYPKTIDDIKNN